MTQVTNGIVLLLVVACSGKSQQPAVIEDAKRVVAIDAAVPTIDARPPFAIEQRSTFGTLVEIRPHDAECPGLAWRREPKSVSIARCRDKPFAAQIDTLREMVAYMRSVDRAFDDVSIVGSVDYYNWPELGRRFIAYAKTHPWNAKKQTLNAYTLEAAANAELFPEYAAIFQRKPKLTSVEKCSAGRPTRKDYLGEFLRKEGATGSAEIPLGCAFGFIELIR